MIEPPPVQVPVEQLTRDGVAPSSPEAANAVIGVWTTALRPSTKVLSPGAAESSGPLVQVSRLGMPLVNEVVAPLGAKDLFNSSHPGDDAQFLGAVTDPEIAKLLNLLYGDALVAVPESGRDDLVTVFLTGVPGLNQPANVTPSEMMRLNMAIPPAAEENPLGVIAGDNAGFPNGRRLGDEVVDVELRVAAGFLLGEEFQNGANGQLGDGVPTNDVPFLAAFPYVGTPHQGFEHMHHSLTGAGVGADASAAAPIATPPPVMRSLTFPLRLTTPQIGFARTGKRRAGFPRGPRLVRRSGSGAPSLADGVLGRDRGGGDILPDDRHRPAG